IARAHACHDEAEVERCGPGAQRERGGADNVAKLSLESRYSGPGGKPARFQHRRDLFHLLLPKKRPVEGQWLPLSHHRSPLPERRGDITTASPGERGRRTESTSS